MKTVVGIYDRISQARNAVNDLVDAGLSRDDVSLIAPDPEGHYADYVSTEDSATAETTGDAAAEGAIAGGVIGGLGGVLVGLGAFAIPGIGPIVAAGPIVAGLVGAGVGAATGGLLGALVQWGVPEEEAGYYAEAVRRGSTLVAVRTPDNQVDRVVDILERFNPVDVNQRAESWREEGWTGYDTEAEHYTTAEIERERARYGTDEYATYEPTFRRHYQTTYGTQGQTYNSYEPAYRYGYTLATDTRYHGRDWSEVEPEARRHWETEHEGAWDQFKDAVRNSWQEVKGAFDTDDTDYSRDYDADAEDEATIPVVEEELRVGKRAVERGRVRVHTHVEERPVEENVTLRQEHVNVQRRPVDRPASQADIDSFQEGTFEVTETAEEIVAEKRPRVVEEVVITKGVDERTETVRDTVRRTEVDIDETDEEWDVADFDTYRTNFRRHYDTSYANTDYSYNQYEPAYRYGYDLATHPTYRNRDWNQIEPEARRQWEERNRGTWDEFKGAVQHGWNELKRAFD